MKIPVLVLMEIDTDKYPDYINKLPHEINNTISQLGFTTTEIPVCFRFFEDITYEDVFYFLGESKESEHIVKAWYSEDSTD